MILAFDIGNTTISCGLFRVSRLARRFDVPTALAARAGALKQRFRARLAGTRIEQAILRSVVPPVTRVLPRSAFVQQLPELLHT